MVNAALARICLIGATLGAAALALGGCGGGGDFRPSDLLPDWNFSSHSSSSSGAEGGFTVFRGAAEASSSRPITPADLVGPGGQCESPPAAGAPLSPVELLMTECELVATAGAPDQVTISTGKAGERQAVLSYTKGDHPGIYTFVSGRLKVVDELPTAAKPEPKKRVAKRPVKRPPTKRPATNRPPAVPGTTSVQ